MLVEHTQRLTIENMLYGLITEPGETAASPPWLSRGPPAGAVGYCNNSWLYVPLLQIAGADLASPLGVPTPAARWWEPARQTSSPVAPHVYSRKRSGAPRQHPRSAAKVRRGTFASPRDVDRGAIPRGCRYVSGHDGPGAVSGAAAARDSPRRP